MTVAEFPTSISIRAIGRSRKRDGSNADSSVSHQLRALRQTRPISLIPSKNRAFIAMLRKSARLEVRLSIVLAEQSELEKQNPPLLLLGFGSSPEQAVES
jgi:hypothetical protein